MPQQPLRTQKTERIAADPLCRLLHTHILLEHPLHPFCTLFPHSLGHMAVDIQSEGGRVMAQVFLDRLHIVAALQGHNGVGVPLRYNNDKPEKSRIFKGFQGFKPDF